MKFQKIVSAVISASLCMSLLAPPINVIADETAAPSETQKTETTESKEPKSTEKQTPNTTEKPESNETEKQAPKETEKPKPAETEKQEPKVTETSKPSETEKPEPKETEKQAPEETETVKPSETEQEVPKETEKPEPAETEKEQPKETEHQGTKESEKSEPKETEQQPKESENKEPSETEQPESKEPEVEEPDVTEVPKQPEGSDSKAPKNGPGTISNAKITEGVLTWDYYDGAVDYSIEIDNRLTFTVDSHSFSIDREIDKAIRAGELTKHSVYEVVLYANDEYGDTIASWTYDYSYESSAMPFQLESITNAKITDGILTWDAVEDANSYEVCIVDYSDLVETTTFNLNREIDKCIKNGDLDKNSSYAIKLYAYDSNGQKIASWSTTYSYNSSANPIVDIGDVTNVTITNGIMTWDSYPNAEAYAIWISGSPIDDVTECSVNLYDKIDQMIIAGDIRKTDTYDIEICALDSDGATIATYYGDCSYNSSVNPGDDRVIKNVNFKNGILTWSAFDGATEYIVGMPGDNYGEPTAAAQFNLGKALDDLIVDGIINKSSPYAITITAYDDEGSVIASYEGEIAYESSVNPITVGKISNLAVTNGILKWDAYEGTDHYSVAIGDYSFEYNDTSYALDDGIDFFIKKYEIPYNTHFTVTVTAYKKPVSDSTGEVKIAEASLEYEYSPEQPQFGSIPNVKITNGILTWSAYAGATDYSVRIGKCELGVGDDLTIDLNENIYELVYLENLEPSTSYNIEIVAFGGQNGYAIAVWKGTFYYTDYVGTLKNVKISNDTLSWDAYLGSDEYRIKIGSCELGYDELSHDYEYPSINLSVAIDKLVNSGELEPSESYQIWVYSYNHSGKLIAQWNGNYIVNSIEVGSIKNVEVKDGVLTWDAYFGTAEYFVKIDEREFKVVGTSFKLYEKLDQLAQNGEIERGDYFNLQINAYNNSSVLIAHWGTNYPVPIDHLDARIDNGVLNWEEYPGAEYYMLFLGQSVSLKIVETSFDLDKNIDELIKKSDLRYSFLYSYDLYAYAKNTTTGKYVKVARNSANYNFGGNCVQFDNLSNVQFANGILSWDEYSNADKYIVHIGEYELSVEECAIDLKSTIDECVAEGEIEQKSIYSLKIVAVYGPDDYALAVWNGGYTYDSSEFDRIKNIKITNGVLTWEGISGTSSYYLTVADRTGLYVNECSVNINDAIDGYIANAVIDYSSHYYIRIRALKRCNGRDVLVAEDGIDYEYDSGVTFTPENISNVRISNSILYFDTSDNYYFYYVKIGDYKTKAYSGYTNLRKLIDGLISDNELDKREEYPIELIGYNSSGIVVATWSGTYTYVDLGNISNVKMSNWGMTWDKYPNASNYAVYINDLQMVCFNDNQFCVFEYVSRYIRYGLFNEDTEYSVVLSAYAENGDEIAQWTGTYEYRPIKTQISSDGILTWDAYSDAAGYLIFVEGCSVESLHENTYASERRFDLHRVIDYRIKTGQIVKDGSYKILLRAYDENDNTISEWETWDYQYDSPYEKITVGTMTASISVDGVLSWDDYNYAEKYIVWINNSRTSLYPEENNTYQLRKTIKYLVQHNYPGFDKSPYQIVLTAYDRDDLVLATWEYVYYYDAKSDISDAAVTGIIDKSYTGSAVSQNPVVEHSDKTLVMDTDYTVSYENNVDVGTATVIITGIGDYNGVYKATFKINQRDISNAAVSGIVNKSYTGNEIVQDIAVNVNGKILEKDTDYTVSYSGNINVGTATMTIIGIGNNTGSLSKTFMINPAGLGDVTVTGIEDKSYIGSEVTQNVVVKLNGKELVKDSDYTVAYADNINAGTATLTITGKGNYSGEISKTFKINPSNISNASVTGIEDKSYIASEVTLSIGVVLNGKELVKDTDYTVAYTNNIKAGTATVVIAGNGNYAGEINKTFKINTIDINSTSISGVGDMPYTGTAVELPLVIIIGGNTLVKDTDYTVTYENNIEIGIATVTVTGIGSCTGTYSATFNIVQAANTLSVKTGNTTKIKYSKLKKKKQLVSLSKVISLSNSQGRVTYTLVSVKKAKSKKSFKKYFKVNASTGVITVKKKLKKGTYTINCKVTASGNENYKSTTKPVVIKIKVK